MGSPQPVEVMHWLATGGERVAIHSMQEAFRARGGQWLDAPMPSVAAANATSMNRILGGKAPDFFQVSIGTRLQQLATHGLVVPIPTASHEWDAVLPAIVADAAKHDGKYVALPIDIHGENWMFFNREVLTAAQVSVPDNWSEFLATAEQIQQHGKIPIALGGQPWQERILFNSVLVGIGGRELYLKVYGQFEESALSSAQFLEVFRVFASLRRFVDRGSPGRGWSDATRMLLRGEAAFQFMGDWAKSEMLRAGLEPAPEPGHTSSPASAVQSSLESQEGHAHRIGCGLAPASEAVYIMAVEAFALAASEQRPVSDAHRLFSKVAFDVDVQAEFNRLNIVAGLERPTRGAVLFDGKDVTALAPVERNVAMVFQSYALYPGMTVRANLSFPLSVRGVPRREARRRVEEMARRLRIEQLLGRRPTDLSGGERQRVAIGRALVRDPAIFLLDEPLSHLDTALKSSLQWELKKLHEDTGGTFVYVTHDASEAMTLATTLAVLDQGRIVQCDRPSGIYERPATQYVGALVGSPPMNFLEGEVGTEAGSAVLRIGDRSVPCCERATLPVGDPRAVIAGFRPEHITLLNEASDTSLSGEVMGVQSTGADNYALIRTGGREVRARLPAQWPLRRGAAVAFAVPPSKWNLFCRATGQRIDTGAAA